jgi:ATP-dependent helicase YprA (DUF1998 family)/serine/threonine protein kinase/very-short-patch-repair endonuclease
MESLIAGRFEVLAPVRSGAMGEVVKARDHAPGEGQASDIVAVKRILCRRDGAPLSVSVGDELVQRFAREVRIMEKVSSPHLPAMIAGGVEGGTDDRVDGGVPYFAMEFIDGDNVKDLVGEAGRLPVAWAAAIGVQAARGLEAVHRASVVHRDVKPANIMLARDGRVRVVDFGIGLILDDSGDGAGRVTGTGVTLGTARYMAPEQAVQGPVTAAADVYALGCVLFELLTGAAPFDGATTFEVLDQHRHQAPTPVRTLRSDVPEELAAVVDRLLAKKPEDRPIAAEAAELLLEPALEFGPDVAGDWGNPVTWLLRDERRRAGRAGGRDAASSGDRAGSGQAGMRTGAGRQADGPGQDQTAGAGQEASGHAGDTRAGDFDIFTVHGQLISDYEEFTKGSLLIRDDIIAKFLEDDLGSKSQWPDPFLSLNPSFESGGAVAEIVAAGLLAWECERIFRTGKTEGAATPDGTPIRFHQHQRAAIEAARTGDSFVLTTGTGSGKSLSYIVPVVDRVLRARAAGDQAKRVRAIIVYPMNALVNSQDSELEKYLRHGYPKDREPVTFARFTGQESEATRNAIRDSPPDILLTNYVMLELMLTRPRDRSSLIRMASGLEFLIFDELHTYRGRQGADVAMLIRRVKDACAAPGVQCIGTSATMSSKGTVAQRRKDVADVATVIFGTPVSPERVIGETLIRATAEESGAVTAERVLAPAAPAGYQDLVADPLASWIETKFGLDRDDEGRLARRAPVTVTEVAAELAAQTGTEPGHCERALRRTLQAGSKARHPETGRPLFAFRLHQFLSKGDTIYSTLEYETRRRLTRDYQVTLPDSGGKILLPLAFCRECGQEYLVVWRRTADGAVIYSPRRDALMSEEDKETAEGYLYVSSDRPWPRDRETAIAERRLPESWLEADDKRDRDIVRPSLAPHVPMSVTVDAFGHENGAGETVEAAFISGPFRFCLRCGVSYEQVRGSDFAKLATLTQEGRSSATTLTSMSIVRSLLAVPEDALDDDARKLLTFVDNRQDAALQAGHFNDYVEVTLVRGALYRAARDAVKGGAPGLRHSEIASSVAEALGLRLEEYALHPGEDDDLAAFTRRALRRSVELRVYLDLDRGWRVTMPNLEGTGLLEIGYLGLKGVAANDGLWRATHPALAQASPQTRERVATVLLDEMRRSQAIDVECFRQEVFEQIQKEGAANLRPEWAIDDSDSRPTAMVVPGPGRAGSPRSQVHMSGRGKLGRYLTQRGRRIGLPSLTSGEAEEVIEDLLAVLSGDGAALLSKVSVKRRRQAALTGYQLRASVMLWKPGEGVHGAADPLSRTYADGEYPRASPYFVRLYREVASTLGGLVAAEHTAQVDPETREDREKKFGSGDLRLLYCSPTMELGVDIRGLNAVSMRNAPPTPANYAQRSGRAGRSGQPALVTTYCATGNSHDQYYFRNRAAMVAGTVAPPRLDLLNEDLLRSHVHAIWLAEAGIALGGDIPDNINMTDASADERRRPDPLLPLRSTIRQEAASEEAIARAIRKATAVLKPLEEDLRDRTSWWDPGWAESVVHAAPESLDRAFDRWRSLLRAALQDRWDQHKRAGNYNLSEQDRIAAATRRGQAETQIRLLRNEGGGGSLSADFNPYRYLASEGFLPGYSFPRLPIAAYIPGRRGLRTDGDYVQRARFLAIREFGPKALIYHEGARYEVHRVQVPPEAAGELHTGQANRCPGCGYHHDVAPGSDKCQMCSADLASPQYGLLELHTVYTRKRQRITSDEEERRRAGYKIVTSYKFQEHGDRPGRLDADARDAVGIRVATLSYGDSALVRRTNLGPARRAKGDPDGFWLDPVKGHWLTATQAAGGRDGDDPDPDSGPVTKARRIIPYVQDTRNILVLRLAAPVDREVALSVMYALERGIEAEFQLEDSELDSELLPGQNEGPKDRILLIESAEGGAGVLRRLQAEPGALRRAARMALEIAHFDPDTGRDLDGPRDPGGALRHKCEKGCYDCLLSYGNQAVHQLISRHLILGLLLGLAGGEVITTGRGTSRTDHAIELMGKADSTLEKEFIQWLKDRGYRLPDEAQQSIGGTHSKPDFAYRLKTVRAAIFIDGPVHDSTRQRERDAAAGIRLEDAGWHVIRVRHDEGWQAIVDENPSVFGQGRPRLQEGSNR